MERSCLACMSVSVTVVWFVIMVVVAVLLVAVHVVAPIADVASKYPANNSSTAEKLSWGLKTPLLPPS